MQRYPLSRLLRVRILRENAARTALALCQERLHTAELAAKQAEQRWTDYTRQRPELEAALFATIHRQIMDQRGMDRYHADKAAVKEEELQRENTARQAAKKVQEALAELDRATTVLLTASRKVQKIQEHSKIWREADTKTREAAAESEQEDWSPSPSPF